MEVFSINEKAFAELKLADKMKTVRKITEWLLKKKIEIYKETRKTT